MMRHMLNFKSPVGVLRLIASEDALTAVLWPHEPAVTDVVETPDDSVLVRAARELDEYFAGERTDFSVPLKPVGTPFQQRVWAQLRRIAYGKTRSYGEIARALGQPTASRAVGAANGRNPLPIFIPCHRVIGASGALTGFFGGMAAKTHLLTLERRVAPSASNAPLFAVS